MEKPTNHENLQDTAGKRDQLTITQRPNAPLIIALLAAVIAALGADYGEIYAAALAVAVVSFTAWTWEEVTDGVNWLRKVLGGVGLIAVTLYLFFQFT